MDLKPLVFPVGLGSESKQLVLEVKVNISDALAGGQ